MAFFETLMMAAANAAPRAVEGLIRGVAASDGLLGWTNALTNRTIRRVKRVGRIAVVSDTNIGDAVVLQGACSVLKRWLPRCEIAYFYQQKAHPLLRANPFIDVHHPVFTDADFTSARNRSAVQSALGEKPYDLILNLYPFLTNNELARARCPVLVPYKLIADIVRAERSPAMKAHVTVHLKRYVASIARRLAGQPDAERGENDYCENVMYLDEDASARAGNILRAAGVEDHARLVFLNPDSSSRFSCIPLAMQVELLRRLLSLDRYDRVLLGPAYSFVEVPDELCAQLAGQPGFHKLVRLPQDIPIDTYAGLIDRADLFITADTAQMHIAAARRLVPGRAGGFRNRTALVTIFGATHSRVYGYDSFADGCLDSSQDAPAKVFEGLPRCKNLTCIHKTRKTCRTVACFTGLTAAACLEGIEQWIWRSRPAPAHTEPAAPPGGDGRGRFRNRVVILGDHQPVIVVSGLPRSGTSLMMQMLEAGGIPVATDGWRAADADNPRGYYELEKVKTLDHDASWLGECRGKAVKVVSVLLAALPANQQYRIIFMERRLPEILASQNRMLARTGTPDAGESDEELAVSYARHVDLVKQALANRPEVKTLYVSYQEILESPRPVAVRLGQFLQRNLDIEGMLRAVVPDLYRQRGLPPAVNAAPAKSEA